CFAGCLPREWHREDETPGIDLVMNNLTAGSRPDDVSFIDWTFSGVVTDLPRLAAYLADRLGWLPSDPLRPQLRDHLAARARPGGPGGPLAISRQTPGLIWRLS